MSYSLTSYSTSYRSSWAAAVADMLINRFRFPTQQVILLQDELATQDNVMSVFGMLASQQFVDHDDRIMVYFAGHGITRKARDGAMVGYLAPIEAEPRAWRTLIRMTGVMRDFFPQSTFFSFLTHATVDCHCAEAAWWAGGGQR